MKRTPGTDGLRGSLRVPGDKSISHRSVIFASLADGVSNIRGFLDGEDCLRTVEVFRNMGVQIDRDGTTLTIHGRGMKGLKEPEVPLYFGNSGTTARLMSGVLAGLPFFTTAYGDDSLSRRPMDRVVVPLREMGASIYGREEAKKLPLAFDASGLKGMTYELPVKSAQVKSAVLLGGLLAEGTTTVIEKGRTRNHTETLLPEFGVDIRQKGLEVSIEGEQPLKASDINVPGDISSAAFFLVAAAITKGSDITIEQVGLNETRNGIVQALEKMGAEISYTVTEYIGKEPVGDVSVRYSNLKGATFEGEIIANVIDEIPILALAATQAEGQTIIRDAKELKVKETDRIQAVCDNLRAMGAEITPTEDGMIIEGGTPLHGAEVSSEGDHRIGMMEAIASLITSGDVVIHLPEAINISYPSFFSDLDQLLEKKS
ncbi:3-phosphoshikimate 1-carboxyvinyltransferase [Salimicrobium halophilum]|uniref:3-phosphoshikimate 1-carboxyvinyltransferase n=1 Tax=Salimicrobium halophilum TaxID=86666 RepID=A0A1G8Q0P6_9BACI|nr:3-phosphoshikimate 1-carboxyvinyltransferase [Salimicrobium halophilum]SDI98301.1 3-phosphoshikimate 1-carboxyvinyltransferase [Salimicrobium halophilum]